MVYVEDAVDWSGTASRAVDNDCPRDCAADDRPEVPAHHDCEVVVDGPGVDTAGEPPQGAAFDGSAEDGRVGVSAEQSRIP